MNIQVSESHSIKTRADYNDNDKDRLVLNIRCGNSSHQEVFYGKGTMKNFVNFIELFLNKVIGLQNFPEQLFTRGPIINSVVFKTLSNIYFGDSFQI